MVTYMKLKSGNWGLRTNAELMRGSQVTVTKRDGSTKTETVGTEVWSGNGVYLYAISGQSQGRRGRYHGTRNRFPGNGWRGNGCAECRRLGTYCPQCAFDEFDD